MANIEQIQDKGIALNHTLNQCIAHIILCPAASSCIKCTQLIGDVRVLTAELNLLLQQYDG